MNLMTWSWFPKSKKRLSDCEPGIQSASKTFCVPQGQTWFKNLFTMSLRIGSSSLSDKTPLLPF